MMDYHNPQAYGFFRQNDEGTLLGHEHNIGGRYGMMGPQDPAAASNRFDRFQVTPETQFQAGDVFNTRGMAPPPPREGGSWRFAGGGKGMEGKLGGDDSPHVYDTSQWIYEPTQQQQAAAPVAEPVAQRQDVPLPPEYDPNRMYEDDDYWLDMARRSTEGMNRLPFVGPTSNRYGINTGQSGYADLAYDPLLVMEEFYPGNLQGWQDKVRDPFEGGLLEQYLMNANGGRKG
jgi:hypothetical protein